MAAEFGVSQPTVREALRALDAMGLIEVRHGSGAYVADDSRKVTTRTLRTLLQMEGVSIIEVLELRALLGKETARLAATNATAEDAKRVMEARDAVNGAETLQDLWEAVMAFQVFISVAAHSALNFAIETFLCELIMQFQIDAFRDSGEDFWRLWTSNVAKDRDRIVEILNQDSRSRSSEELQRAMVAYLEDQRHLFANNTKLAAVLMSDVASIDTLAEPMFTIPDYRSFHQP